MRASSRSAVNSACAAACSLTTSNHELRSRPSQRLLLPLVAPPLTFLPMSRISPNTPILRSSNAGSCMRDSRILFEVTTSCLLMAIRMLLADSTSVFEPSSSMAWSPPPVNLSD